MVCVLDENIFTYFQSQFKNRLVNNLCICVFYFKFKGDYMVENGYEADSEMDTPDDWKILTEI